VSDSAAATTVATAADAPHYEGVWRRFLATLMDNLVWLVFVLWIFGSIPEDAYDSNAVALLSIVLLTAWFNYFAIAEWRWGQTIGKNALGVEVTTETGERPSWNAAAIRNLLRIVDFLLIGPIMIATSGRRQRLGDRLAHTVVVRKERPQRAYEASDPKAPSGPAPPAAPAVALSSADPPPPGRGTPPASTPPPPNPGPATAEVPAAAAPPAPRQEEPPVDTTPPPGDGIGIAPGGWRPVHVLLAVLSVIGLSIVEVGVVAAFDPELEDVGATLAVQALLAATLIGVAIWFAARHGRGNPLTMLGLRRCKWSALGLALAAFGGYIVFAAIYAPLVQPEQEDVTRDLGFDEGGLAAVIAGFLIIAAAPLSEEIFFRGFMFAGLRRRLSLWPAAAVAAIIFGALHYTGPDSIGVVPQLAVFGLLLAWLYEYTGSLWPPILVHVINNTIAFVVVTST
jgi:membrane protease YdiL (CAAX protease family)/uncharacterized RDD family membrane protein YckC